MPQILRAEALGYDSVWTAEKLGSDAITPLAYIAALTKRIRLGTGVMQLAARSPANAAMCGDGRRPGGRESLYPRARRLRPADLATLMITLKWIKRRKR